jgi:hypothetical protein
MKGKNYKREKYNSEQTKILKVHGYRFMASRTAPAAAGVVQADALHFTVSSNNAGTMASCRVMSYMIPTKESKLNSPRSL